MPSPPPAPAIAVNPAPPGLVGLDTWFWLTPAPTAITTDLGLAGYQYRLVASPVSVSWNFGDGSPTTSDSPAGFGQPYPARSTVRQAYERYRAQGFR